MFRGSIHYVDAILWLGRNAYPADRNEYYDSASKIYMSYPPIPVDPRLNAKKVKIHRTQNRWKRMPGTSRVMHWNSKYFKLHFAPPYFSMTRKNKNATAPRRLQIANAFYIEINVLSVYHSFPLGPSIYAHWFYSFIVSFGMLKRHTDQRYTALYGPMPESHIFALASFHFCNSFTVVASKINYISWHSTGTTEHQNRCRM